VVGKYECDNEPSGSIKRGEFLYYLRTDWLLKKEWSKELSSQLAYKQGARRLMIRNPAINQ
jgi:hypothetical protein